MLILSTFAGCRKINADTSSGNISDLTSTVYDIVDIVESDDDDTESVNSDTNSDISQSNDSSSNESTNSDNNSSSTSSNNIFTENIVSVGDDDNNANSDGPATFIEPDEDGNVTNTEITEYNGQTLATAPDNKTGNVITVPIAAGGRVYYKIRGVSNKILTIKNANAYVIYNGVRYDAVGGVVSFVVVSDELSSAQILFEIGNKGSSAESFTINFTSPKGSRENPDVINSIDEDFTINIPEGAEQGYCYKYIATESGKIRFYILSDAEKGQLSIDKIIDKKLQVVQQRNTTETEEDYVKTDETGTYVEFDVKKGDEFSIVASPNSKPGVYPAVTIVWKIEYK